MVATSRAASSSRCGTVVWTIHRGHASTLYRLRLLTLALTLTLTLIGGPRHRLQRLSATLPPRQRDTPRRAVQVGVGLSRVPPAQDMAQSRPSRPSERWQPRRLQALQAPRRFVQSSDQLQRRAGRVLPGQCGRGSSRSGRCDRGDLTPSRPIPAILCYIIHLEMAFESRSNLALILARRSSRARQ